LGKTSFELVPDVEVNLVFNFHSIWSIIAPESSFGRNEHILGGKICSRILF
jgi:hypothetical protein